MKRRYFGTDGVRGEFGGPVVNAGFAWRLGVAAGRWLRQHGDGARPRALIGRDTRFSGPVLENALTAGLESEGIDVASVGIVPTPAVALAVTRFQAAMGAVVTASHNPAADNGIKFFSTTGIKLPDRAEAEIEILLPAEDEVPATIPPPRRLEQLPIEEIYLERMAALALVPGLAGWKIVVDAGNGAAYRTTAALLRRLGAEVVAMGDAPDGRNINAGCGSQHPEGMRRRVAETGARLGIAHDGDADRLIVVDEAGAVVDGDELLAVLAGHALRAGRLAHRTLVATVQSNLGLKRFMEEAGGRLVQTAVGDRYVIEAMLAGGYNLGGENSGHIVCTDVSPCGDGLAAALLVLAAMRAEGRPLSELRRHLVKWPQETRSIRVARKPEIASLPALSASIREGEARLGADGRVFVRYSGTEPKIRLLVEGPDAAAVAEVIASLERAVDAELVRGGA
jgi:phosphoglucosamine mutase